jgi:hypothetical protein
MSKLSQISGHGAKYVVAPALHPLRVRGRSVLEKINGFIRCPLCGKTSSLDHIAAGCQVALDQGRYLWRHNQVLKTLQEGITRHLGQRSDCFAIMTDLDNRSTTLPIDIFGHTRQRPDMVITMPTERRAYISELTCPLPRNMGRWNIVKKAKYSHHIIQAETRGWEASLHAVEVASSGLVSPDLIRFLSALGLEPWEIGQVAEDCGAVSRKCTTVLHQGAVNTTWRPT